MGLRSAARRTPARPLLARQVVAVARLFRCFAHLGTGGFQESRKHVSVHEPVMLKINTRPFAISPAHAQLCAGSQQLGAFESEPGPFAQPKPVARGNDEAIESGG